MAHYIQDYLYSELPDDLIPDCLELIEVNKLPNPGLEYEHVLACLNVGTNAKPTIKYFMCKQTEGIYEWKEVFQTQEPALPKTDGVYLLIRKDGKYDYTPYNVPEPYPVLPKADGEYKLVVENGNLKYELIIPTIPTSEGTYVLVIDSEGSPSYESTEPEPPVPPTPEVPDVFACVDYTGANLVYDDEDSWTYTATKTFDSNFPFVLNAFGVEPITSADIVINAGEGLSDLEVVSIHPSYVLNSANDGLYKLELKEGKDPVKHVYVNFKMKLVEFDEERTNSFEVKLTNIKAGEKDLKDSEAVREIKFVPYKEPVVTGPVILSCIENRMSSHHSPVVILRQHPDPITGDRPPVDDGVTLTFLSNEYIKKLVFKFELDPTYLSIAYNPAEGIKPEVDGEYDATYDKEGNITVTHRGYELPMYNHLNVYIPIKVLYEGSLEHSVYTTASIVVEEAIDKDNNNFVLPDDYTSSVKIDEETH